MAKLRGAAAAIAEEAKMQGLRVEPAAAQSRLPLADPGVLALEMQIQPTKQGAVQAAHRRGRPKGSRNRRSEDLVRYILAKHSHPLLVLAETYSRPVHVLAAELNCTPLEAFQLQQRAATELAPYIESKKPVAVQVDSRVIQLTIHAGEPDAGAGGEAIEGVNLAVSINEGEGEQKQQDSAS